MGFCAGATPSVLVKSRCKSGSSAKNLSKGARGYVDWIVKGPTCRESVHVVGLAAARDRPSRTELASNRLEQNAVANARRIGCMEARLCMRVGAGAVSAATRTKLLRDSLARAAFRFAGSDKNERERRKSGRSIAG